MMSTKPLANGPSRWWWGTSGATVRQMLQILWFDRIRSRNCASKLVGRSSPGEYNQVTGSHDDGNSSVYYSCPSSRAGMLHCWRYFRAGGRLGRGGGHL